MKFKVFVRRKRPNNRFDLSNPLARNLQEQQSKLRAKPFGPDLQVKRMLVGFDNTIKMGLC
jgi:hypothetical protein